MKWLMLEIAIFNLVLCSYQVSEGNYGFAVAHGGLFLISAGAFLVNLTERR